jgi:hypothetical protein
MVVICCKSLFEQSLRVGSINTAKFGNSRPYNFVFRQSRLSKEETEVINICKYMSTIKS